MGVAGMLPAWVSMVQALLPGLHGHQAKGLAAMALAMSCRLSCRLSEIAPAAPSAALPASGERRFQRLLANPRLRTQALADALAAGLLASRGPGRLLLTLDESTPREPLKCLRVSVGYQRRCLPLAWRCYDPSAMPAPMDELVRALLLRVAACLPPGASVTLLADRGLAWPSLLDLCAELGWHYVLRLQGPTRLRRDGLAECALADLTPRPGRSWAGAGEVFKKGGWRALNVVASWPDGADEPWLLVSDLPPTPARLRDYAKRMWIEESFRDDKSHGFDWQKSLLRDPEHASRLLLALALAVRALFALGSRALRRGRRRALERPDRRTYSVFGLGRRALLWGLYHDRPPPCTPLSW